MRKLEVIEEKSDHLLHESETLRGSLSSIAAQTNHLTTVSKAVGDQIGDVLERSKGISEQSNEIAGAQAELKAGQVAMRDAVDAGMAQMEESYESLGDGMDKLKEDAATVEEGIRAVGDAMSSKMDGLQRIADDIGGVAGRSLENQMQLLDCQAKAMRGLNDIYSFQAKALEESRKNSDRSRPTSSLALDKLYVLHNTILVESRFIKAFFFYCCIAFLIYMLASAKQTFANRTYDPYSSGSGENLGNYSWVVEELQDEVDSKVDADYVVPQQIRPRNRTLLEGIGENSITTSDSRKNNLRPRIRPR